MNLAVISLGGKSSNRIAEEAKKYFKHAEVIDIRKLEIDADTKGLEILYMGQPLKHFDCVYIRGSYKYVLLQRALARSFMHDSYTPICPEGFFLGHNKFLTMLELQRNGVRIPKTYFAATTPTAKAIIENRVNFPILIKIPYGTQGKGVMFADSIGSAHSILDALEVFKQPYLIQEYIEAGASDIRAVVIGKKVIGYKRKAANKNELRANIHLGGYGVPIELHPDTVQVALKSAKAVGADICAVDILEGHKPAVIEVNLSPGLEGISKTTKLNVADMFAKFLYEKTIEYKNNLSKNEVGKAIKVVDLGKGKEILTSIEVKNGSIRLPKFITDLSGFSLDDEVQIDVCKGKISIKEHKISKPD